MGRFRSVNDTLGKDGSEDDGYFLMGMSYDESLRDGEVSVGIVALRVEG